MSWLSRSGCPVCISVGENCLDWCGKTQPSVVAPFVTFVEDYGVEEGRGVPGMHACMHFPPFLTTDVMSLATSGSGPDFPTAMDYDLEF